MLCCGNRRFFSKYRASTFSLVRAARKFLSQSIDLFTNTAAILNLFDLRSVMGRPAGTRSVFTRAFWTKRELHCIFLRKKAIIITSKHGTIILFSHYNLFLGKRKEKLAWKAGVKCWANISDSAHAPWASHSTTLKSNSFNMAAVSVKRSIYIGILLLRVPLARCCVQMHYGTQFPAQNNPLLENKRSGIVPIVPTA